MVLNFAGENRSVAVNVLNEETKQLRILIVDIDTVIFRFSKVSLETLRKSFRYREQEVRVNVERFRSCDRDSNHVGSQESRADESIWVLRLRAYD